ncbi:ABC-type branched-subunit amino acid transport system substrate-binding protein [Mucilaginibacter gracilis]|uniref:ABC-type branched-subunit amino acid transport system substrate-binding protein n=1 Tax=Mucilaginibacter gracilis TaxID=423350 RepID=A0A495J8U3_9SPHI|nr:ABC transporter substrate-binding protein [Mucilaginibacter gracilis]RKR85420.1 ABC-type branched-subunit amino acid transport system substrate-binding protein [Mucilaginibacter gracilis]
MTLAQSHRLPSSGNKWIVFVLIGLVLGACSPKLAPVTQKPVTKPVESKTPDVKVTPKVVAVHTSTVSLILPFELNKLDLSSAATSANLSRADLAVGYYQGFKLALDSLTAQGYNFKLQVFDSNGDDSQAHSLAGNTKLRTSDLIVGPVFPEGIKAFSTAMHGINKPLISPLSPAAPAEFKNNNLVTIEPPLEYHAWRIARYIKERLRPVKVFVLKSGYSDENKYILPFKKAIDSLSRKRIQVVYLTVTKGNLSAIIPQLSTSAQNIFIVPATDQTFLAVTLAALDKLNKTYPVTVFGHPNWYKSSFLQATLLQRLKTYITVSDKVDYNDDETKQFIKAYRDAYHLEPSDYAIKGFDDGYYLGTLLSTDTEAFKKLDKLNYLGLHNQFSFIKTGNAGWVNTHVSIYQYQNFELKPVE